MRLPLVNNLKIVAFNGTSITDYDTGMTNAIAVKKNGRLMAQQRPAIDVFEDASSHISDARGRGLYYWDKNSALYIINNDTIYKNSQSNSISTSPTAGTKKCKFVPVGNYLVLLDAENGEGWTINTSDTVASIADADFPSTLAYGGAVLNGALYVMDADGIIYGSDIDDPTAWATLNFIEAERKPDGGTFLGAHHDHIVAYGPQSIEFVYDAANTTGSPLSRREDVAFRLGCNSGESVWEDGDRSFFIGVNNSGALGVYTLQQFNVRKVSEDEQDSFITQLIVKSNYSVVGSGISGVGRLFYILTFYITPSDVTPALTLMYDDATGLFSMINTTLGSRTTFPLIDWTIRDGVAPRYGEGIFSNGDLFTINDNLIPQDTVAADAYVTSGYVDPGYISETSGSGTNIDVTLRTGQQDHDEDNYKFCGALRLVGEQSSSSQTVTIKHANENNDSFSAGKTIDVSKRGRRLTRLGRYVSRNWEVSHSSTELLQLEAIKLDLSRGNR